MSQQQETSDAPAPSTRYGGFWIRVLATVVDLIVVNVVGLVTTTIIGVNLIEAADGQTIYFHRSFQMGPVGMLIWLIYSIAFIASPLQATPGKLLVKLKVTDNAGQRLGVGRALGRELAKFISGIILLIGFIMVAFTDRKRGLHDMIASTLVMYRG